MDLDKFKEKYSKKIEKELHSRDIKPISTNDYENFKKEYLPAHMTFYEKACNISEKILRINPDKKKLPDLIEAINISHLNITPTGASSLPIITLLVFMLLGLMIGYLLPFALGADPSIFIIVVSLIVGLGLMAPLMNMPYFLANNWRMKASNQMVLCIFYIVTYMRHTSNLEQGLDFAAEHLGPPLAIDLKKIIWNIETEKFQSTKESVDDYLQTWRKWNLEFIESVHLIESSLYETSESRRLSSLDKSLSVMLDETYEKMLHYAQNLKSPITTLHMLGIILPILGLVILPLLVSFMPEVKWYHLFFLYNIVLPGIVFYMGKTILSKRPTGYGEMDITETHSELKKFKNIVINIGPAEIQIHPIFIAIAVTIIFLLIGFSPLIIHTVSDEFDCTIGDRGFTCEGQMPGARYYFLGYREEVINGESTGNIIGPYGIGATVFSLAIPLAFGLGAGLYFSLRSRNVRKIRENAKKLEQEFASALFQLGNRIGDGYPAEIAFGKVSKVMEGTLTGKFFDIVSTNIRKLGMSVENALFDVSKGAVNFFPSPIIESGMKVLIESSKKGPMVASNALINVSNYIKEMHRVDERLKDLMADIISSMKSQILFLTPAISGIVIGITSMITTILGSLGERLAVLSAQAEGQAGSTVLSMFGTGIPTFYFQMIVGLYVVEIVFLLTILVNGIEAGADKINERYLLGKNMIRSTVLYCIIAFIIMLIFNIVAGTVMSGVATSLG